MSWAPPLPSQHIFEADSGPLARTVRFNGHPAHAHTAEVRAYSGDTTEEFLGKLGITGFMNPGPGERSDVQNIAVLYDARREVNWANEVIAEGVHHGPPSATLALDHANQYMHERLRGKTRELRQFDNLTSVQKISIAQLLSQDHGLADPKWISWYLSHPEKIPGGTAPPAHFRFPDLSPVYGRERLQPDSRKVTQTTFFYPADHNREYNPATNQGGDGDLVQPFKALSWQAPPNAQDPAAGDPDWGVNQLSQTQNAVIIAALLIVAGVTAASI